MSEQGGQPPSGQPVGERSDPRLRPPDPAGTQPKVDPRSLDAQPRLGAGQATFLPAPVGPPAAPPEPPVSGSPALKPPTPESPALKPPTPESPALKPPTPESPALESSAPESLELDRPRPPAASQPPRPHAPRFQFLFGALGALGVCAVVVVVLLLSAPKAVPGPPWSAWHPADNGIDPAQQIAEHVAPTYQMDNGKQIVQVTGGPPAQNGQPLTLGVSASGQQAARLEGNSVLYRMCGGGPDCSIKEGKPSVQRGLLLSREALELALYTFHYVEGVDQVIVTIPPPPHSAATKPTTHALMFRPQDVAVELGQPLDATLSPVAPRVSQMDHSSDATLVAQVTGTRLYDYVIDEVPESHQSEFVLLLSPPN